MWVNSYHSSHGSVFCGFQNLQHPFSSWLSALTERHLSELVPFQILVANETPTALTDRVLVVEFFFSSPRKMKNMLKSKSEIIFRIVRGKKSRKFLETAQMKAGKPGRKSESLEGLRSLRPYAIVYTNQYRPCKNAVPRINLAIAVAK